MIDDHSRAPAADPTHDEALPYVETTDDAYGVFAAQRFTIEEPEPGTTILRGPCPRCKALIEVPVVDSIFRSTRNIRFWRRRTQSTPTTHAEPMMCTCEVGHPNRPDGLYGCGAYWTLIISAAAQ